MKLWKIFFWLFLIAATLGAVGCQSTGDSYTGSDGHAGHDH